eukprot:251460_1
MGKSSFNGVGGKAANTSVACSKLGAETSFIGAFGDDSFTDMLINEMKKYNVNISTSYELKNSKISCGAAYIFLMPDGDNSIVVVPSANHNWPNELTNIQIESIKNSDCILLQREIPEQYNIRIAKIAKDNNIKVILDVGGEDTKISKELLNYVDILSPNETELQRLINYYDTSNKYNILTSRYSTIKKIKGACSVLQSFNKDMNILLKRGNKGSIFIDTKGNIINQPAMQLNVNQIKDTTGAGDCFTGSFAIEWIRQQKLINIWNKKQDEIDDTLRLQCVANAMKFANVAAGLSVQKKGTIASIPNLKDVVCSVLQTQL